MDKVQTRSLLEEISNSIASPAAKKRFLSAPYLPFRRYLGCYQEAFETGAALGYVFRNKIHTFAKLFCKVNQEQMMVAFIQELAHKRLADVKEAQSFFHLAMAVEENRIRANNSTLTDKELNEQRFPLVSALQNLQVAVSIGIGLGATFPELTEGLWKAEHEYPIDGDQLAKRRKAGLDIPNELEEPVTLATREIQLLPQIELFVRKFRPELLAEFEFSN